MHLTLKSPRKELLRNLGRIPAVPPPPEGVVGDLAREAASGGVEPLLCRLRLSRLLEPRFLKAFCSGDTADVTPSGESR